MSQKLQSSLLLAFVLAALVTSSLAVVTYRDVIMEEWNEFKVRYNKTYPSESEDNYRFKLFVDSKYKIATHNRRQANGLHSYTLGLNKYADMSHQELVRIMNGYKPHLRQKTSLEDLHPKVVQEYNSLMQEPDGQVGKFVDWRLSGYVTPVKDQGQCGSCWAFSSTGALEGHYAKKVNKAVDLSEQNLVDCSKKYGNMGCDGGLMENAFKYIRDNHGIDTEVSYPYEAHDDKCRFKNKTIGANDKGYVEIPSGNERKLTQAIYMKGPISVAIDASQESFHLYKSGVYNEPNCGNESENLDHGVLVVGYGTDLIHGDYYIVKNSWSETWGEAGYIRMARNKDNQCGIATNAVYPVV